MGIVCHHGEAVMRCTATWAQVESQEYREEQDDTMGPNIHLAHAQHLTCSSPWGGINDAPPLMTKDYTRQSVVVS